MQIWDREAMRLLFWICTITYFSAVIPNPRSIVPVIMLFLAVAAVSPAWTVYGCALWGFCVF